LKELRKSKLRRPDIILTNGDKALSYEGSSGEVWSIFEQMFIAAIDSGDSTLAEKCLSKLRNKFPKSARVNRLVGIYYEFTGKYDTAMEIYKNLLIDNPSNLAAMKRKVCIFKATGKIDDEILELNNILKMYPSDFSTWLELGDRYFSRYDLESAAHCYEELVLLDPYTAHTHTKLADTYYTIGGATNILNARKHFIMSLNIQCAKLNTRAFYGLIMTCKAFAGLSSKQKISASTSGDIAQEERVNDELLRWLKAEARDLLAAGKASPSLQLVLSAIFSRMGTEC